MAMSARRVKLTVKWWGRSNSHYLEQVESRKGLKVNKQPLSGYWKVGAVAWWRKGIAKKRK